MIRTGGKKSTVVGHLKALEIPVNGPRSYFDAWLKLDPIKGKEGNQKGRKAKWIEGRKGRKQHEKEGKVTVLNCSKSGQRWSPAKLELIYVGKTHRQHILERVDRWLRAINCIEGIYRTIFHIFPKMVPVLNRNLSAQIFRLPRLRTSWKTPGDPPTTLLDPCRWD